MMDKTCTHAKPEFQSLNFKACIFDFDGVIVDSEAMHAESKRITVDHF